MYVCMYGYYGYDGKLVGAVKCHMTDFGAPCRRSTVWHVIWKQLFRSTAHHIISIYGLVYRATTATTATIDCTRTPCHFGLKILDIARHSLFLLQVRKHVREF